VIAEILLGAAIGMMFNVVGQIEEGTRAGLTVDQALGCLNVPEVVGAGVSSAVMTLIIGSLVGAPFISKALTASARFSTPFQFFIKSLAIQIGIGAIAGLLGGQGGALATAAAYEVGYIMQGGRLNIKRSVQTAHRSGFLRGSKMTGDLLAGGVSSGFGYTLSWVSAEMGFFPHPKLEWRLKMYSLAEYHPRAGYHESSHGLGWKRLTIITFSLYHSAMEENVQSGISEAWEILVPSP
jgi:hypothetical protein